MYDDKHFALRPMEEIREDFRLGSRNAVRRAFPRPRRPALHVHADHPRRINFIRCQVLMDIANQTGGLVIGTGDLSELALGWCTYNGDHMSNYAVNCSIPKTLVRHLVAYLARDNAEKDAALTGVLEVLLSAVAATASFRAVPSPTALAI